MQVQFSYRELIKNNAKILYILALCQVNCPILTSYCSIAQLSALRNIMLDWIMHPWASFASGLLLFGAVVGMSCPHVNKEIFDCVG